VETPLPGSGELDHLGERACSALLREPEQRDEDLCGRERIRQRAMTRLGRRAEEVRELSEREALAAPLQQPAREPDGVHDRRCDAASREPLHRVVEESDVEARVVRGEGRVVDECEKAPHGELLPRRAAQVGVAETRQPRDRRREGDPRIDERLEGLGDLE
jgi:hypothetical protein